MFETRWDGGHVGPAESSVADFIAWPDRGGGRAFVRRADPFGLQIYYEPTNEDG